MHDLKWIRENPEEFDSGLAKRGLEATSARILDLDRQRRECVAALQDDQARRNEASKAIGMAKGRGEDAGELIAEVATLKTRIQNGEERARSMETELTDLLSGIPNLPDGDVPEGPDEAANVELRQSGRKPGLNFEAKEHFEIGQNLGMMDFETAAKLSGARFVLLSGALSRLERALGNFMIDIHTNEFGYTETSPPLLVRDETAYGTGNLPKFADDLFRTQEGYWLIPTAEMPLSNIVRGCIIEEDDLPRRYTAMTPCFRSEAGAAGKDTRGMIRQHQFLKVELVSITAPDESKAEHERMTACAEEILKRLGLHYRVMLLSSGDMGFSVRKTYDIEVWLPGQGQYREISSCSNCGDFQGRRMKARYRPAGGKGTRFVHTLNGSGLAVGRTLVAVLENYQRADGTVTIPEVLRPYMGGLEVIEPAR